MREVLEQSTDELLAGITADAGDLAGMGAGVAAWRNGKTPSISWTRREIRERTGVE